MNVTLSPEEIHEITGKVQPAAQLRALRRMGIRAYRKDDPEHPVTVCRAWLQSAPAKTEAESRPRLRSDRAQAAQTR